MFDEKNIAKTKHVPYVPTKQECKEVFENKHLISAARLGCQEEVKALLSMADIDVNKKDHNNETALIHAILFGHSEIVKFLLENGADVNIQTNHYLATPLMLAIGTFYPTIEENYHLEIVKDLLSRSDIDVNKQTHYGETALLYAVGRGDPEIVSLLIEKNVDINVQDHLGVTLLMEALISGRTEIAKLLIENGAETHIKDNFGHTVLEYAKHFGHEEISEMIQVKENQLISTIFTKESSIEEIESLQNENSIATKRAECTGEQAVELAGEELPQVSII